MALIACLTPLTGCRPSAGAAGADPPPGDAATPVAALAVATSTAEPSPSPSPTPVTALDPQGIWVGVDGKASAVASVAPDGAVTRVRLPLAEGQLASNVAATRDGQALAYLVWDEDGAQEGIAVWPLAEEQAQLVARPAAGSRIVALALSAAGSGIAYAEVEEGTALPGARWAIKTVPLTGGEPALAASRETLADTVLLMPFAWPEGGPVLLSPAIPELSAQGIYAASAGAGGGRLLVPAEGQIVSAPSLSPDGVRVAYLTHGAGGGAADAASTVQVHDLRLGEQVSISAPAGHSVLALRWHPDGERLLLDVVGPSPADDGSIVQAWAIVSVNDPDDWQSSQPDPSREGLFDYAPAGEGVVYTTLPEGGAWRLTIAPTLIGGQDAQTVALDALAQDSGVPFIIRIPHN